MEVKTRITSTKFKGPIAVEALAEIEKGDRLMLRRDPSNRYDSNAIEVYWMGHNLGFIPKKDNPAPAAAMDAGKPVECVCENNAIVANGRIEAEPIVVLSW